MKLGGMRGSDEPLCSGVEFETVRDVLCQNRVKIGEYDHAVSCLVFLRDVEEETDFFYQRRVFGYSCSGPTNTHHVGRKLCLSVGLRTLRTSTGLWMRLSDFT